MSRRGVALAACIVLAWVLVHTAWLCDDAYITLRTIDNFTNGFGLRWNVVERVQSYTHPAWLLLMTPFYALTRDAYYTTLAIQGVLSLATMLLLCRLVATTWGHSCFAAGLFLSSKALVDFSTGGLENPLTHFLLVALFLAAREAPPDAGTRSLAGVFALASLVTLSRQDLVLLILPMLWPWLRLRHLGAILLGAAPAIAWYLFSLIYYGQLVPNTALAKLSTGIPWTELVPQGFRYWAATASMDPVTVWSLGLGCLTLTLWMFWRVPLAGRIALGVIAYSAYIVWVGGDFMSGRFLTAPLVWVLVGLVGVPSPWGWWSRPRSPAMAAALVTVVGLFATETAPLLSGHSFGAVPLPEDKFAIYGVTDERRFYFPSMGLMNRWGQHDAVPAIDWARLGVLTRTRAEQSQGREVIPANNVGLFGYFAGPRVHIVDRYGLADPVLARLPALGNWRIGHFTRRIPDGYLESRRAGQNLLTNPSDRELYDLVILQTQGPLFTRGRFGAIVKLQTWTTR